MPLLNASVKYAPVNRHCFHMLMIVSVKYAPVNRHCFHMLLIVNGWMDRWIVGCTLMGVGVKVG